MKSVPIRNSKNSNNNKSTSKIVLKVKWKKKQITKCIKIIVRAITVWAITQNDIC